MYEKSVLENGLRVLTSALPHTQAVSVTIFVGAGSRYESDEIAGVSHFLEHMLFKGTERRRNPRELAEAIEGIGGAMNAATDKELTAYWAKVPAAHFDVALDVLLDQLLHSRIDPVELERERKVVIEELAMVEDNPGELVGLLLDELMWPEQPLGRDIAGSPKSVEGISRETMVDYLASHYVPENTVISVAGNLSHETVVSELFEQVESWEPAPFGPWSPARDGQTEPRVGLRSKRTEQTQIALGFPAYSAFHPDRYALDVMNTILGEGMSSRLFLEIREIRGLAYDVHSSVGHYLDTGAFVVGAAVDPRKTDECIRAIRGELDQLRSNLVPSEELTKAKEYIKGRLVLRMEDSRAVSSWIGGQELLRREVRLVDDVLQSIEAVTAADVRRVAQEIVRNERANLAIVGPYRSRDRFRRLLD
ncbi:MAG TPA: pitrilysin family protein [Chloroflexota bacterium]|nr:pitrilysin family protein [Chloroflexota bacterium]